MTEPDIEKKRKKRRRSARFYISTAHPLPTPEQIAALADQFPSDADDDGQAAAVGKRHVSQSERKRLAREGKAVVNPDGHISYPIGTVEDLHNAATLARTGHGDVEAARRLIARRAKELGVKNPLESSEKSTGNPYAHPGVRSPVDRMSPPLTAGHQSPSSGDHGASADPMRPVGPRELAFGHPDLRNGTTSTPPLLSMQTHEAMDGSGVWSPFTTGRVALTRLDAAGASGVSSPPGNAASRPMDHIARNSATPPNGTHGLADPRSHAAPMAAKSNSELRAEFKRMLFPGSGGGR